VVPLREKQPRSSQQATREVLQFAQRTFGESIEERAAINEEAVPDNEEFQSTNEGLLISKEDLQSLNEGLSALNSQLKEALKRQCTTSDDLQNILNSSNIALHDCVQLSKPANKVEPAKVMSRLLPGREPLSSAILQGTSNAVSVIFVVEDDEEVRATICDVLADKGRTVGDFVDAESFLAAYRPGGEGCLLLDAYLPGMSGVELLVLLRAGEDPLPTILFTGRSDVSTAVAAMRAGASDYIEKPVSHDILLASIDRALGQSHEIDLSRQDHDAAVRQISCLTPRQRQVMQLVLAGHPSKNIASDLGISQRTVENHRASIMHKTGTKSLPELARLAVTAELAEIRCARI
jgi:two-component system CheB/CheR fusion protein